MLVLARKEAEKIVFPSLGITVELLRIQGRKVRIGISAPPEVPIARQEVSALKSLEFAADENLQSKLMRLVHALRVRLERENAPEDLLDDAWLVELTLILPELRARYPDLSLASVDESTARARLFEALARLSVSLSARRPLVWLVDDSQWADRGTLELLHYLKRSWRTSRSPILLLILIREEAFSHGSALRDWMSGLTRDIVVTRLTLAPMQASEVQQLLQSLAGENAAGCADLSAWLTAETAGRPFFVVETLAALEDYGALVWVDGEPPVLDPLATLANLKSMGSPSDGS